MIIGISGKIGSGKDTVGAIIQYLTATDTGKSCYANLMTNKSIDGYHNSDWKIVKYADKLKDIVCILLGCTREQLEDREFKETPLGEEWTRYGYANGFWSHSDNDPSHKMMDNEPCDKDRYEAEFRINWQTAYKRELTPRLLLQLIGTECGRQIIHPNIWVNATMNSYKSPNEIKTLKDSLKSGEDIIYKFDNNSTELPNWIITDVRFPNEAKAITDKGGINIRIQKRDCAQFGFEKHLELADKINGTKEHESETALDNYKFDYVVNHGTIEALIEQIKEILLIEKII